MKNKTKYCFIQKNGDNYQLSQIQTFPNATYFFDQIVAHTRFLMPLGAIVSGGFFIFSLASGVFNAIALELILCFLGVTGICYFPNASFPTGISALIRNNRIRRNMKNYYDKMRALEVGKNLSKEDEIASIREQKVISKKLIKLLIKLQKANLRQAVKFEKKLSQGKELSTAQSFAYGQIESSMITIDKFIFHNYSLLKEFCADYEGFITKRVNSYYNNIIVKNRYLSDEIIRIGLNEQCYNDEFISDDIMEKESSYPQDLCSKLKLKSVNKSGITNVTRLLGNSKRIVPQKNEFETLTLPEISDKENEI